jgi:hypothetical protein
MTPILWGAAVLLVIIAGYEVWLKLQPTYDGEPVSDWVDAACGPESVLDYRDQIPKIGAPAVPYLIAKLKTKGSGFYGTYTNLLGHLPQAVGEHLPLLNDPAVTRQKAADCLAALGPISKPAIPQLTQDLRQAALIEQVDLAMAIWKINGDTNLVLQTCHAALTQSTNDIALFWGVFTLSDMGPAATPEVPALLPLLASPKLKPSRRYLVARALGRINCKSDAVIAALQEGMKNPSLTLCLPCAQSLWKLDHQYARAALTTIVTRAVEANRRHPKERVKLRQLLDSSDGDKFFITNSIPILKELQQGEDADIRQFVTEGLQEIVDKSKSP